jgi:hypothetical protein
VSEFFASLLTNALKAPESVPRGLLGLDGEPLTPKRIKRAFVRAVKLAHPDVATGGSGRTMDELVWARDVLLRDCPKPKPVTGEGLTAADLISRNAECVDCGGRIRTFGYLDGLPGGKDGRCEKCTWLLESGRRKAAAREARRQARADRVCACGVVFTPSRSDGLYCAPACRQRAYRARRSGQ